MQSKWHFRRAQEKDCLDIFNLSNDKIVRNNSLNTERINWEDHVKWFNEKIIDPNYVFYVLVSEKDEFIGQVRFEIELQDAVISLSIIKKFRFLGAGSWLLKKIIPVFLKEKPLVKKIKAVIKPDNLASIKVFEKVGFVFVNKIGNDTLWEKEAEVYPNVTILTEGGHGLGCGHIMRCHSLAQAFEEKGIDVNFVVKGNDEVKDFLKNQEIKVVDWINDKDALLKILQDQDIVIIDSYLADLDIYKQISQSVKVPVFIDDNNRLDYPQGVVVNGSVYAQKNNYPVKDNVVYLTGKDYVFFRKEFWDVKKKKEKTKEILVTMGGTNIKDLTARVLRVLIKEFPDFKKNIVIGNCFTGIEDIKKHKDKNTVFIDSPDGLKMKELMTSADLAICAGGQTLNELCLCGVPGIAIILADNQILNVQTWEEIGGVIALNSEDENFEKNIINGVLKIEQDKIKLCPENFIDSKGSVRIIKKLLEMVNRRRCAIMQPTYLPWIGYFDLIDSVDVFVFLDDVKLEKCSWQVRNRIKNSTGELLLTVPVKKTKNSLDLKINETEINNITNWQKNHLDSIYFSYKRAPYFSEVYPFLESLINSEKVYLKNLNINIIKNIAQRLGIKTKFVVASEMQGVEGKKDTRLVAICNSLGCREYFSPKGSAVYIEAHCPGGMFSEAGIGLKYQNYEHPVYAQLFGEFLPFMSIVDLLFNHGFEKLLEIIRQGRR